MTPPDSGIYEALVHPYRRRLLLAMLDADRRNAAYPDPLEFAAVRGDDHERGRIEAIHVHLPKLDAVGVVRWERKREELSKGPRWSELEPLLRWMDEHRDELPEGWLPAASDGSDPVERRSES